MRIDKMVLATNFDAVSGHYEEAAVLQKTVLDRTLERLEYLLIKPVKILDLGSGTGLGGRALTKRFSGSGIVQLDLSKKMLQQSRNSEKIFRRKSAYVCADQENLPFDSNSFDLVFSNLSVQWSEDFSRTANEITRILRPNGLLVFSSLGPKTLTELKISWAATDDAVHVNEFDDIRSLGDVMLQSGLIDPVLDSEMITLTYDSHTDILKDLKRTGVVNVRSERRKTLTGKNRLAKFGEAYEAFRQEGKLPASYEVIYGHAWAPEKKKQAYKNEQHFPLSDLTLRQ